MSNFSFCYDVFKSRLLKRRQKASLCGNGYIDAPCIVPALQASFETIIAIIYKTIQGNNIETLPSMILLIVSRQPGLSRTCNVSEV